MRTERFWGAAAAAIFTATSVSVASAQTAVTRAVTRVVSRPGTQAHLRESVAAGTRLNLLREDTIHGYLYVSAPNEVHGWVHASRVRLTPAATPAAPALAGVVAPGFAPSGGGGVPGTFHGCALIGDAKSTSVQALNRLKNRANVPANADVDPQVSLAAMLKPGDDRSRWNTQRAATILGFVVTAHKGGDETVNCHATDPMFMDTHINLALSPDDSLDDTRQVIVEVAPRWRPNHPDWTTADLANSIQGHWVRFTGWLLFDAQHATQSENTAPGNPKDWRGTGWELHPVTNIEILPGRPNP
jgi:hypothetical protein